MTNEQAVVNATKAMVAAGIVHNELHNAIFGPVGIATQLFTNQQERKAFSATPESDEVRDILAQSMEKENKKFAGNVSLKLPASLHSALQQEAQQENVELHDLILSKLAVSLFESCNAKANNPK